MLTEDINNKEQKWATVKEKRAKKKAAEVNRIKRLGKRKFEEPDLEFNRPHELAGNLRALQPDGNILGDRFYSMQKRNMLEVTTKQLKYVDCLLEYLLLLKVIFRTRHQIGL